MTYIIAEIGCNHNGDIDLAKKMIEIAKTTGVDAVKFQTFNADNLVTKSADMAQYQKDNLGMQESQYQMIKKLELTYSEYLELKEFAENLDIEIFSTAFDMESLEFLISTGMKIFKIPSGELTNLPYLRRIAQVNEKIILSTGMATTEEIDASVKVLRANGAKDISILHCTTDYPTELKDVNLNVINDFKKRYVECEIGYSDHTIGSLVSVSAVAMGATIIEKHFTLDKSMEGPDHIASATPDELKEMVDGIRQVELALGDSFKKPTEAEMKNRLVARKSIVALKPISKGEMFTEENITIKRPGSGISPMLWDEVLGKVAQSDFQVEELIEIEGMEPQSV